MTAAILPKWMERAACAGNDPALWDVRPDGPWREGVVICGTCPVKAECLQYALSIEHGPRSNRAMVFGGLTPMQRERVYHKRPPGEPTDFEPGRSRVPETCRSCGRALRPQREPAEPGTVRHQGRGLCCTCWREDTGATDRRQVAS